MTNSDYKDLAPNDAIENGDEYLYSLNWALQDPKIKNIALTGPYGSGKSSIIDTFLKQNDSKSLYAQINDRFHGRNVPSSKNSLKISMATFSSGLKDSNSLSTSKVKLDIDEIETGILKQLFYKVKYSRIPQSRYRKLHTIDSCRIFFLELIFLLFLFLFCFVFKYDFLFGVYQNIVNAGNRIYLSPALSLVLFLIVFVIALWTISLIYRFVLSKFTIKQFKISDNTSIESSELSKESVFNKNLDEIVYFFEETNFRYVFFEDLDRLDNPERFVHLRELNTLLNNDDAINKPIIFIYAVKDDIFVGNDRTKFFDFIIPVVPIINSTNSSEILLQKINPNSGFPQFQGILQETVFDVAPFISDMRTLQNICNEFIVYKNTLANELSLSEDKMFAIMAFKNLYPKDFSDLQNESGVVKEAFSDKQKFIYAQSEVLQHKIEHAEELLKKVHSDVLQNSNEVKFSMLISLAGSNQIVTRIYSYSSSFDVDYSRIMTDSFDLLALKKVKQCRIECRQIFSHSYYTDRSEKEIDDLSSLVSNYVDRWQAFHEAEAQGYEKLKSDIETCKLQQKNLSKQSLKNLINYYSATDVLSSQVCDNKLLVFLLRRGYIDEEYTNYINYFKGTSITKDDMNFILSVKTQTALPFDYTLNKTEMVINRLQPYEFEQKEILNYALLERLFDLPQESEKFGILFSQFHNGSDFCWNFIDSFIDITKHLDVFVQSLASSWKGIWLYIFNKSELSYKRKIRYLSLLITYIPSSELQSLNQNNSMAAFIESHPDILQMLLAVPAEDVISCIESLNIKFSNVHIDQVPTSIISYIFDNDCYIINRVMTRLAILHYDCSLSDYFISQKPYTAILSLKNTPVNEYVQTDLVSFVENVLADSTASDDVSAIIVMLESSVGNADLCEKIITYESFRLPEFCCESKIDSQTSEILNLWNLIVCQRKIISSFHNVTVYWSHFGLTSELLSFIISEKESLCSQSDLSADNKLIQDIISSDIDDNSFSYFIHRFSIESPDFPFWDLSESKLSIMIDCNYFPFTIDGYLKLKAKSKALSLEYILKNQHEFIKVIDSIEIDQPLFEELICSSKANHAIKSVLLKHFSKEFLTTSIALSLVNSDFRFTNETFNIVWPLLNSESKKMFFLQHLDILNADDFERIFTELSFLYPDFSNRDSRHIVKLTKSPNDRQLASRLKETGYISNIEETEKDDYLRLRIRSIKRR